MGQTILAQVLAQQIWVVFLLTIEISQASALTAALNLFAGFVFIIIYWQKLNWRKLLLTLHVLFIVVILFIYQQGNSWLNEMSNLLYLDKVVYSDKTRYQQLTFTQRNMGVEQGNIVNFYLNGRLQFSSADEKIYHSYLVSPVLAGSARQNNILIIGGGDGLALRDVLRWKPKKVTLIDLDKKLITLFAEPEKHLPYLLAEQIKQLNKASLTQQNVELIYSDAFIAIDQLLKNSKTYDAIIVDLPDPSHPDLNKLYSVNFYARLNQLLSADGLMAVQSTSPYHAKNAFISIGKTIKAANFNHVEQYHDNVPSFGEWGWSIASKSGKSPLKRLKTLTQEQKETFNLNQDWLTLSMVLGAFDFSKNFYQNEAGIPINYLGSHAIYQLHQNAWRDQQGLNNAHLQSIKSIEKK